MNDKNLSNLMKITFESQVELVDSHLEINNQVLRKIKIVVKSDVKNLAYISLR